jgi:hypothetical protein
MAFKNIVFMGLVAMTWPCSAQVSGDLLHGRFVPDTTLNTLLKLGNSESTGTWSEVKLENENMFFVAFFTNSSSTEYTKATTYPGGTKYAFYNFEVGELWLDGLKEKHFTKLPFDHFQTEGGIHLGISKKDLIRIKGKEFTIKETLAGERLVYKISLPHAPWFLNKYHMPEYLAEYQFRNGVLVQFSFGFPYP